MRNVSLIGLAAAIAAIATGCASPSTEKSDAPPAAPAFVVSETAKPDDHSPDFLADLLKSRYAETTPFAERGSEYTPQCWKQFQPYINAGAAEVHKDSDLPDAAKPIQPVIDGDHASITFTTRGGAPQTDIFKYVNGAWLYDC